MKKLIALFLYFNVSAGYDIQVDSITKSSSFEMVFNLNDHNYEKITLDCQGFLNGVVVKQLNGSEEKFHLGYGQCADIYGKIKSSLDLRMPACLKLDFNPYKYHVKRAFCK